MRPIVIIRKPLKRFFRTSMLWDGSGTQPTYEGQTMRNKENQPLPVDWSRCDLVRSHPGFLGGTWCLKSAPRMPADAIVQNWDAGHSVEELSEMWEGITREQIEGILHFARGDRSS